MAHLHARKGNRQVERVIYYTMTMLSLLICCSVTQGADHPGSEMKKLESATSPRYLSDQRHATVIYFLIFGTETVLGVTPKTIEKTNDYVIRFSQIWPLQSPFPRYEDHSLVNHLRTTLVATKVNNHIDQNLIRLKVKFPEATFDVDEQGIVWQEGTNHYFQLTKEQMNDLTIRITSLAGVVDVKAGRTGD